MNGWLTGGCRLGLATAVLAVLAACSGNGDGSPGGAQCNCPDGVGEATIELCGAIGSVTVEPDGACSVQEGSGKLYVQSDVAGTCHVEVTFATSTVSTDIVMTMGSWMACGSDPHGCGQTIVATPATVMLGPCGEADGGRE